MEHFTREHRVQVFSLNQPVESVHPYQLASGKDIRRLVAAGLLER